ncbi:MAG: rRNA ((966)-N(2))-methyltransferase RsmD [Pseudomonadota bacterium]|jgi:16S rRNA (guanine966-N2)-methyltransferase
MNSVRIIGGRWRRSLLHFPDSSGLRPTPDRVRETLFNWLGQELDGLRCLDLFAGSGALGFEAASRNAAQVVLIEQSAPVHRALLDNQRRLQNAENLVIRRGDALKFSAPPGERFDVLFLDPPYHQGWLSKIEPLLPRLLQDDAVIYVEAEHALTGLGDWKVDRQGQAGQVFYHLMRREPECKTSV